MRLCCEQLAACDQMHKINKAFLVNSAFPQINVLNITCDA